MKTFSNEKALELLAPMSGNPVVARILRGAKEDWDGSINAAISDAYDGVYGRNAYTFASALPSDFAMVEQEESAEDKAKSAEQIASWAAEEAAEKAAKETAQAAKAEREAHIAARTETVRLIRALFPNDCGEWSRADLSGLTWEKVQVSHPGIKAAYLGGQTANVLSGTYGNSGESWSLDLGTDSQSGEWYLAAEYCGKDSASQAAINASLAAALAEREKAIEETSRAKAAADKSERMAARMAYLEEVAAQRAAKQAAHFARTTKRDEWPQKPNPTANPPALNGLGGAFAALGL